MARAARVHEQTDVSPGDLEALVPGDGILLVGRDSQLRIFRLTHMDTPHDRRYGFQLRFTPPSGGQSDYDCEVYSVPAAMRMINVALREGELCLR